MIVSPKKILWPTDFSTLSLKAAEYARGFRDVFGAELHVITVLTPVTTPGAGFPVPVEAELTIPTAELLGATNAQLKRLVQELFPPERGIIMEALVGTPWHEICTYARRENVDLIVVGTHGRTGIRHVLIGSTAERIVRHAACPVLTVKSVERDFTIP